MLPMTIQERTDEPEEVRDITEATTMLSNLCNVQMRVNCLSEKMRELAEMNHSGMSTVNRINMFQDKLEQLQCLVNQDLYKTGEIARCQYKLITDIDRFMDVLKCEGIRLRTICLDLPREAPNQISFKTSCGCGPFQPEPQPTTNDCCCQQEPQSQIPQTSCGPCELSPPANPPPPFCGVANNLSGEDCTPERTSDLFISDLHPMGKFVKIFNASKDRAMDIGGFSICQIFKTESYPERDYFMQFRFPLRVQVCPGDCVKVWGSCFDPGMCKSPTDFVSMEVCRWMVCDDVVTKLSDNSDKTVSWIKGSRINTGPGY